jgi:hypothetical protein
MSVENDEMKVIKRKLKDCKGLLVRLPLYPVEMPWC